MDEDSFARDGRISEGKLGDVLSKYNIDNASISMKHSNGDLAELEDRILFWKFQIYYNYIFKI